MEKSMESHSLRLMVYRMVVVLTLFLATLGIQAFLGGVSYLRPFYYLIAFVLLLNLLHALLYALLKTLRGHATLIYLQLLGDILSVTLLAFFTGGITSIFTFLYEILIVIGGVVLIRRGAFIVASLDAIFFGLLCVFLSYGWANPLHFGIEFPYEPPSLNSTLHVLAVHYVGFFLVALLMGTISRKVKSADDALGAAEKNLSTTRMFTDQLVESLAWGVIRTDREGVVTHSNPAGMRLLGVAVLHGWTLNGKLKELGYEGLPLLKTGNPAEEEVEIRLPGKRLLALNIAPLKSREDPKGYLVLVRDQTEMARLREELALKDRLAATGAMAIDIAHEIRNPLGSISGAAQMLSRNAPEGSREHSLLTIIQEESQRLSKILNNILGYAQRNPLHRTACDCTALVEEVLVLFSKDAACRKGIELSSRIPEKPIMLSIDADRVRHALWNLLTNAAKAVSGKGKILISLTEESERVILAVEDDGMGMAPSEVRNFFQPFKRGFAKGTGLGLSMVYQTMELHGGRIEIKSKMGKGTVCELIFPGEADNG